MQRLYKAISVAVGVLFLIYFFDLFDELPNINFHEILQEINYFYVFLSLAAYLFSHFLKALRIAVLIGRQDYSLWKLIYMQYYTNGINLILPFKLGEAYRIVEFNKLVKDYNKVVLAVITEKTLDLLLLFPWAILSITLLSKNRGELSIVIWIVCALIVFSLIIFFVLPENIRAFNLLIAKRYNNKSVVKILAATSKLSNVIESTKLTLRSNVSTISLLTILIWLFEVMGFVYMLPYMVEKTQIWLLSILVFLSGLIPSASLGLGGLQLGFAALQYRTDQTSSLTYSLTYQAFIFSPAVFLGFVLYVYMRHKSTKISAR
jgi:hypothetical protein